MSDLRLYRYIGSSHLLRSTEALPARQRVLTGQDVRAWAESTHQEPDSEGQIVATFIVDATGALWIADRRSEHVNCARGEDVRAAGEMGFELGECVQVVSVTNQSTGYCPEPTSWSAVAAALHQAELPAPTSFTQQFLFRRCHNCGTINVVKDEIFECPCGAPLSQTWDCDPQAAA